MAKPARPRPGPAIDLSATPAGSTLNIEYLEVNAALARKWLEQNTNNRNVRRAKVNEFRRDMLAGNWLNAGDPVRFDTSDDLMDGQHRLIALVEADETSPGISIPLIVISGLPPEVKKVLDSGTRRTASDNLRMEGRSNPHLLAAAAKWCHYWDKKLLEADTSSKNVTTSEITDYVNANPQLIEIVDEVARYQKDIDMPGSFVCAAYFICWRIDQQDADDFFHRIADGVGLNAGDPILALRKRLRDLRHERAHFQGEVWLSLLIRTWNAKRDGQTVRRLQVMKNDQPIACPPAH